MLFDDGRVEAVREPLPELVIDVFAVLTGLGDPLLLVVLAALVYWLTDHETGVQVLAALVLVFGLTTGLKQGLALERPPPGLWAVETDGFGLPSGHTSGAVVGYGTLAALYEVGPARLRYGLATVLAGLVSVSRVVIGVHYPVDVLAGAVLGTAVVVLTVRLRDRSPVPFFAVGAVAGLFGAWHSGFSSEAGLLLLGAGPAAIGTWYVVTPVPAPSRRLVAVCSAVTLPLLLGTAAVARALRSSPVVLVAAGAVGVAVVLGVPAAGAVLERALSETDRG